MDDIRARLHAQVTPKPSGCLVWREGRKGYGRTTYGGKKVLVHRLAWEAERGPIPEGLTIDHVRTRGCIYKRCINVAHLELVTLGENVRRARPRFARGLADQLRTAIERGEITSRLPSLTELTAQTGIAFSTVQKAIRILKNEGLIITVPGRGTFVRRQT